MTGRGCVIREARIGFDAPNANVNRPVKEVVRRVGSTRTGRVQALLQGSHLKGSLLKGSLLKGSLLKGSLLKGSLLKGSLFKGSLSKASLFKGSLSKASLFKRSLFKRSLFKGVWPPREKHSRGRG
jgi:uncharacterized protein YjbI with pentapeptide repeats